MLEYLRGSEPLQLPNTIAPLPLCTINLLPTSNALQLSSDDQVDNRQNIAPPARATLVQEQDVLVV